mmetsp:Transcript_6164/g.9299  ORF Transcript_6164/g.9299 Transcript_6164/m.9299 type:complete len:508 (-) Transcript_6164:79-1602(-)|eukprot:CAMPEP_0185022660 /NCGR_PEP_ID=MMETSP1103-20130426/5368_1 /TAXON_ID=36769 /ORGANISM="Paraphysomonas bandaiensis, Strain Caron Lab Isolate" /LENGTH=507 /DNA_ID=CAMNT_0027554837 /DNA_START=45 /DNA_END=1568 /DNA_ORIENTATION=-
MEESYKRHTLYPEVPLHPHSPILSFEPVHIKNSFVTLIHHNNVPETEAYSTPPPSKPHTGADGLDAKSFFLKMYGKKDMFSKEIIQPEGKLSKAFTPVDVDTEETLLQISAPSVDSTPKHSEAKTLKTSLTGLFGSMDASEDVLDVTSTHSSAANSTSIPPGASTAPDSSFFDAFGDQSQSTFSAPASADAFSFDAFESTSAASNTNTTPFAATDDLFSAFSSSPAPAADPVVSVYDADVEVTSAEELMCMYKGTTTEKFDISGSVHLRARLKSSSSHQGEELFGSEETVCVEVEIKDPSSRLSNKVALTTPHQCSLPTSSKLVVALSPPFSMPLEWPSAPVMKYRAVSTFRPEFVRCRVSVSRKDGQPGVCAVSIHILLNKNFNLLLENIQVLASFTPFADINGEVKSRPTGAYNATSKVLTWRCGSHYPSKQPALQMDALVTSSSLPTTIPVIVKACTSTSLIPDCNFDLGDIVPKHNGEVCPNKRVNVSNVSVTSKSKIEYRFF